MKIQNKKLNKTILIVVAILLVIIALLVSLFLFFKRVQHIQDPSLAAREELAGLKGEIGKLYELPSDEEPTLAQVADITKLVGQPFFSRAHNGDKVLIYEKTKKAILYRPSIHRIIEVSQLTIITPTPSVKGT